MLVNIDAEMSEILSVYPHFQNLAAPFHSVEHENWMAEVGRSLYAKGGGDLIRKVLIELRHAPEDYSEVPLLSYHEVACQLAPLPAISSNRGTVARPSPRIGPGTTHEGSRSY